MTPKVQHHGAILEPQAIGELLRAIDTYSGHLITRLAMQISPHVMARPGELRMAKWPEFDLEMCGLEDSARANEDAPAARGAAVAAGGKLSTSVARADRLRRVTPFRPSIPRDGRSARTPSTKAFRRLGYAAGEVTAHGLRTTASTLLNESGKWSPDAIERSLAHADKDSIRGIYNRGFYWEERVAMHQWWSDYLDELRASVRLPISA